MTQSEFVGCRAGWFSVGLSRNGEYELKLLPDFTNLLEHYGTAELILVDIPIGLPEGPGGRVCDREASEEETRLATDEQCLPGTNQTHRREGFRVPQRQKSRR